MTNWINSPKDALIYVGDTMCSWCHGFSPELDQLIANHPELDFHIVNGGLRPHGTEKNSTMADFLRSHWVEIAERTGQPFAYDILEDMDFVYDTEPSARAVITARIMNPEKEYEFFKAVQMAFYRDNKDTNKTETYVDLAGQNGFDKAEFEKIFLSEDAKLQTQGDFQISSQMGVKGFPSMVIKLEGQFIQISNGFRETAAIEETIKEAKLKVQEL
ncbi:MAG: putative protein-disulfide isomerase [Arenicella sp.]|jgi:putative protein-disulfide isomerase